MQWNLFNYYYFIASYEKFDYITYDHTSNQWPNFLYVLYCVHLQYRIPLTLFAYRKFSAYIDSTHITFSIKAMAHIFSWYAKSAIVLLVLASRCKIHLFSRFYAISLAFIFHKIIGYFRLFIFTISL